MPEPSTAGPLLSIKVGQQTFSARRVARKWSITVISARGVLGVTAVLKSRTGAIVARGRMARLKGKGELALHLPKQLKKGVYVLSLAGHDLLTGVSATQTVKLTLR